MPSCLKAIQAIQREVSAVYKVPSSKISQTSCQGCHWISLEWYQSIASRKVMKS